MKTTTKLIACLFAPALLILSTGCKKKVEVMPAPESRNVFLGSWEGKESSGNVYRITFTSSLQWEAHIEESGVVRNHYKGTYQPEGMRVRMKVTDEVDLKTMGWRPERGNVPSNMTATVSGNTLKVADVLTDAVLRKR
jgi:hypothetical protein